MTPSNIAGMAMVKGLDVIAVTDHNSCKNCEAVMKAAKTYPLLVIAGMELTTVEEVHVLCLFSKLEAALAFDRYVYEHLTVFPNQEEIFGRQLRMNEKDEILGVEPNLLIQSTTIGFEQVYGLMEKFHGVMVPAHINKNSHSVLSNLGFIPLGSQFSSVEVSDMKAEEGLKRKNPYLQGCRFLCNSDAHYLGDLHEPVWFLEVEEQSAEAVLRSLL